jgi:serine/threonine protein kinase
MGNQVSRVKYDTPYDLSSKPDPQGRGHFKFTQNGTTYRNLVAIRMLGSGGVGRVFLVKDADANQHYALKVIDNQLTDERVHDIRGALALVRFVSKSSPFAKVFESYYYNSGLEKSLYIVLVRIRSHI